MIIWTVSVGQHDNGWDGIMRIFCPTKKIALKVKAKLKRDMKNGIEPAGFSCGGNEEGKFDYLKIDKCDLGDVSKAGRKDLVCFAAWRLLGGAFQPQGGVVGAQTCWQILDREEDQASC